MDIQTTNYGRTAAIPKAQALEIVCVESLPEQPEYKSQFPIPFAGKIIEPGSAYAPVRGTHERLIFSPEDIKAMRAYENSLWIYGYMSYEGFLGEIHTFRFCKSLFIAGDRYAFVDDGRAPKKYIVSD